jgi:hypothetical protein
VIQDPKRLPMEMVNPSSVPMEVTMRVYQSTTTAQNWLVRSLELFLE